MNLYRNLGEVSDTIMGQAPPGEDCNKFGEGVPFVKAGEFGIERPIIREWTTKPLKMAKRDDILICVVGATSGKINKGENCAIGRSVAAIRVKQNFLDVNYLYYFLKSWSSRLLEMSQGAAQTVITKDMLYFLQIPLPSLSQQQKIAKILNEADELRQNDKVLIAKYDELMQALFIDMFGDPVSNPKGWEKVELKKICSFKKKNIKPEDIEEGKKYVALDSIEKGTGNITNVYNVEKGELKSNKFWFDNSFILYGKLRPYLNKVALPNFEGVCSTDIIPIQPINTKSNKLFVTSILRHNSFVAFADERSSGANLPRISPSEIEKYSTINPPIDLQNKFADRVALIEEQKEISQKSLVKSGELFNSLLQKAFKGELCQ